MQTFDGTKSNYEGSRDVNRQMFTASLAIQLMRGRRPGDYTGDSVEGNHWVDPIPLLTVPGSRYIGRRSMRYRYDVPLACY